MQLAVSKPEMLYYWQMTVWSSVAMHTTLGSVKALTAAPPHRIWGAADFKMVQRMTVTLPQAHSSTHIVVFPLWLLNPFSPQSPWTSHLEKCRSHWKACSIFTKKKKKKCKSFNHMCWWSAHLLLTESRTWYFRVLRLTVATGFLLVASVQTSPLGPVKLNLWVSC